MKKLPISGNWLHKASALSSPKKTQQHTVWSTVAWVIIALIVISLAFLLYGDHPLHSDEGAVLNIAWQLWNGNPLYTQVVEFTTPGSGFFVYGAWRIVGEPSYASAKIASILFWIFSAVPLVLIVRRFSTRSSAAFFALLLWLIGARLYPLINHNVYSSFLVIWVVYFLLVALSQRTWQWYILTGLASGGVFLFLQTKGLAVVTVSLCVFFLYEHSFRDRCRASALTLLGFVGSIVPLFFVWNPAVLFTHWFILPRQVDYLAYTIVEFPVLATEMFVVAVMATVSWALRDRLLFLLTLVQGALFLSSTNLVDVAHFGINSVPVILMITRLVFYGASFSVLPQRMQQFFALFLVTPVLLACLYLVVSGQKKETIYNVDFADRVRPGIFGVSEIVDAKSIYAGPFLPGLYFELRKPNPFTMAHNMTLCSGECQEKALATFQEVSPEFALVNYTMVKKFGYNFQNPLDQYIWTHYRLCDYHTGSLFIFARDECPYER